MPLQLRAELMRYLLPCLLKDMCHKECCMQSLNEGVKKRETTVLIDGMVWKEHLFLTWKENFNNALMRCCYAAAAVCRRVHNKLGFLVFFI